MESLHTEIDVRKRGLSDYRIDAPFYFADGDALKIILRSEPGNSWSLTDEGHTLMYLSYHDTEINNSPARQLLLDKILSSHFMECQGGRLVMPDVRIEDIAAAVFTFAQGILKVGDMTLWKRERVRSMFMENFRAAASVSAADRECVFDYRELTHDPHGLYVVDCYIIGRNNLRFFLYAAHTNEKAKDSMVSMYHYNQRLERKPFFCAVFNDEEELSRKTRDQVADIADKTISSLAALPEMLPPFLEKCESASSLS